MRVALAGRNGSGKSTLLKIMAGQLEPTEGKCNIVGSRRLRIGFVDQTLLDKAVVEMLGKKERSLSPIVFIQERSKKIHPETALLEMEWEIRKILGGLGFTKESMEAPMSHLSGGWLLRMFIACTLLDKPEVLLLDEPTNHLDLSSIQWLEEFLSKEYEGSLVLVTHDVALQRRTTDSLAILHGSRFYFRTHQRDYLTFRESLGDEKRILEKNIKSVEKKMEENMEFVRKFRAKAQTAARAQSKLKAAEKFEEELHELKDRLLRLEGYSYNLRFHFRLAGSGGKFPISLKNISFRYSQSTPWILNNISLDVKRGQRIAIIGDNGSGKTTLLNVLAEKLVATEGELLKGHAVELGYFGQHQLGELSLEDSLLDNLRFRAHGVGLEELRGWLGAFGFSGNDEIEKKARVLSGGERTRLALLGILVTRINLCLLDEPTNHLDIETKELLKNAIRKFEGTTIFVSHDREFVGDVAERILYLSSDHRLTDHLGSLSTFFEKYPHLVRHIERRIRLAAPNVRSIETPSSLPYEERKRVKNAIRALEKKVTAAEEDIDRLGHEKDNLHGQTLSSDFYSVRTEEERKAIYQRISEIESTLHTRMVEWEKWSTELEDLRKQAR